MHRLGNSTEPLSRHLKYVQLGNNLHTFPSSLEIGTFKRVRLLSKLAYTNYLSSTSYYTKAHNESQHTHTKISSKCLVVHVLQIVQLCKYNHYHLSLFKSVHRPKKQGSQTAYQARRLAETLD